jgi:hypothetical protein
MKAIRKLAGPEIYSYTDGPEEWARSRTNRHVIPCVYPNWDNSPRSGRRGLVITGSSPDDFASGLRHAVATVEDRPMEERLVWIKSWEWAEGNYLEPNLQHGRGWLQAARTVLLKDA